MKDWKFAIDFERDLVHWDGLSVKMPKQPITKSDVQAYNAQQEVPRVIQEATNRQVQILNATYEKAHLPDSIPKHLTTVQQRTLLKILKKHEALFDGKLGTIRGVPPVDIVLKPGTIPVCVRPYPIPISKYAVGKNEVRRLESIGVLGMCNSRNETTSQWGVASIFIPKKNGEVRFVSDLRPVNACMERKPHPMPETSNILSQFHATDWITVLDYNMGFYTLPLTERAQRICSTVLPWGKYYYKRLPMGLKSSTDIFQGLMDYLFGHLDYVLHFLDDCAIRTTKLPGMSTDDTYRVHMRQVNTVLTILEKHGFQINAKKCSFASTQADYLGFRINREGVSPLEKKVRAILALKEPGTRRQVRSFLGFIQYYRDMYRLRSHILAPLTALTSTKVKFKWTEDTQTAFDRIKQEVAKRIMLVYPDFNQPFHVYTDASNIQLGAVITQGGRPIAFFSRKLTPPQLRYTVTEKELLSIVETLKAYKKILFGLNVTVFTDHKNLTTKCRSQRG